MHEEPIIFSDAAAFKVGSLLKDEDNPDGEIEIIFTGLRPGEKLYEELLIGDNVNKTKHKKILRAEEDFLHQDQLNTFLEQIKQVEINNDVQGLKKILEKAVPGFVPERESIDVLDLQKNNSKFK